MSQSVQNANKKTLALFDLDHTLLDIDSDYTWGEYLVQQGLVDEQAYRQSNEQFYQQYIAGTLDATEYNEFVATFLTSQSMDSLHGLRQDFLETQIKPHIRPLALQCIEQHRNQGDEVLIISATNDFVVSAIAQLFAVDAKNVLATPLEVIDNRYTGKLADKPNFQAGKLYHLNRWLADKKQQGIDYQRSYAYSDSKNDLPLLEWADVAVCISPDDTLQQIAMEKGWQIEDWSIKGK